MTTATVSTSTLSHGTSRAQRPSMIDVLVARLAVAMLRWSRDHARRARVTHQQQLLAIDLQRDLEATQNWADRARHLG